MRTETSDAARVREPVSRRGLIAVTGHWQGGTKDLFALAVVVGVYLALALPNLKFPGLNIDEAADGLVSEYILKPASAIPDYVMVSHVELFGRIFPVMGDWIVGAYGAYLIFPFLKTVGDPILAVRTCGILLSAGTLVFLYFIYKEWFGRRPAIVTTALAATHPAFVQFSRVSFHREEMLLLSVFSAALFLISRFMKSRRAPYLLGAGFMLGIGLGMKVTFLWYLVGLGAAWTFWSKRLGLRVAVRQQAAFLLAGVLGAGLLVTYNIADPGVTPKNLFNALFRPERVGLSEEIKLTQNNMAYLANLRERAGHLLMFLKGTVAEPSRRIDWGVMEEAPVERLSIWSQAVYGLSVLTLLLISILRGWKPERFLFLMTVYATVFLISPFTVSSLNFGHLMVLFPLPALCLALLLEEARKRVDRNRLWIPLWAVLLGPLAVYQVGTNRHFTTAMPSNGGRGRWATAIEELASNLKSDRATSPVTLGYGVSESIAFLTRFEVTPRQYNGRNEAGRYIDELKERGRSVLLVDAQTDPNSGRWLEEFRSAAAKRGKRVLLKKVFNNIAGTPVYWLYQIDDGSDDAI